MFLCLSLLNVTLITVQSRFYCPPLCCRPTIPRETPKVSDFLQDLVRKGIPHHFRAIVWQLLCNAQSMPIKDQYSELLKMTSPCEKLIRRDIARTYPEHEFFKEKDSLGQEVLFNVMKVQLLFCLKNLRQRNYIYTNGKFGAKVIQLELEMFVNLIF